MLVRPLLFVLLLGATLSGCASSGSASSSGTRSDADAAAQLTRLDDDWSKAAGTRDADRVASFYANDAVAYPPNEPVAVGRDTARKVWAAYLADPSFSISWKTTYAEVNGDLGYTAGTYQELVQGPGRQGRQREGQVPVRVEEAERRELEGHPGHVEHGREVGLRPPIGGAVDRSAADSGRTQLSRDFP